MEGQAIMQGNVNEHRLINPNKMQLGYGKPSGAKTIWMLYVRMLASIFNLKKNGFKQMFMRLFSLPLYFLILWAFYFEAKILQRLRGLAVLPNLFNSHTLRLDLPP
ncbi:hypothetical protein MSG28_007736 [Choristoneura fumiferana]|uniref:Uncharacterized protein n=1 Tax=Choristoneura fumiferana TaxID=7141 RepID=A0ACC0JZ26_CHOFU|nr:hypothetical protein MSG28_007736 [Choristoneura fumiferana]